MLKLGILSLDHPHAEGNHFPALKYLSDKIKVTAVFHPEKEKAQKWLSFFNADYCVDRDILLSRNDIDAVLITSKNNFHAADSIAAAEAGKDIFCDKPIAINLIDAQKIVQTVRNYKVKFITTFPVRYNTSVRNLKKSINEGRLGKITAIMATNHGCMYEPGEPGWVKDPAQNGGGCIIDHTVHVADIIRWITGAEFYWVKAEAGNALRAIDAEDIGVMHGELTDGSIFQIDASWSRRGRDPMWGDVTFRVIGTKGSATLDLYNNQYIAIYKDNGIELRYPNYLIREHGEIFLDYCINKGNMRLDIAADEIDGLRSLELVFAAYGSIKSGEKVMVDRYEDKSIISHI